MSNSIIKNSDSRILIYGANGYTGRQVTNAFIAHGVSPILAGRSDTVREQASELNCEARVFTVGEAANYLKDVDLVVNLAGPFVHTQQQLIEACLATKTHYMDVSGEYADAQRAAEFDSEAIKVGVTIMTSVGIFAAPMDMVASIAAGGINKPTHLQIGFESKGTPSRGSTATALGKIQSPGVQLVDGVFETTMPATKAVQMSIFGRQTSMVTHPWRADLLLAKRSTGVANIETFSAMPGFMVKMMRGKLSWLKYVMENLLMRFLPEGPTPKQQAQGRIYARAVATNGDGVRAIAELKGPDAYVFTAASIVTLSRLVTRGASSGFMTPAQMGTDWIFEIGGIAMLLNGEHFGPTQTPMKQIK